MIKSKFLGIMLLLLGLASTTLTNCGDTETTETCAQDEICTGKNVTSCCDQGTCVYKYNGKEYSEDQISELADDLGCASGSGARIAADDAKAQLIDQLKALMEEARAGLN